MRRQVFDNDMSTILVLGSNSPSGASMCAHALDLGLQVIATSRSPETNPVFLPYKWKAHQDVTFHEIDLNKDMVTLGELLRKHRPKYVFNFASQSMVGQSWDSPTHWMQTNVVAVVDLLELLRNMDFLDRYVHVSTPEVYGSTSGWTKENRRFDPSSPYAASRAAGDMNVALWFLPYAPTFDQSCRNCSRNVSTPEVYGSNAALMLPRARRAI